MSARAVVSLIAVAAALVVRPELVLGQSDAPFASARSVRIQVSQTYVDEDRPLRGITLPAATVAARILGYAGLKGPTGIVSKSEILQVSISITGNALSANYMPGGLLPTGASVEGTIAASQGDASARLDFSGQEPCPQMVSIDPGSPPFATAFDKSDFPDVLLRLVAQSFGSKPLVKALADPSAPVRRAAAGQLGALADPSVSVALIPRLKDPDASVRVAVADSLGTLRAVAGVPPLLAALKSRANALAPEARTAAVRALGAIGDAAATPALVAALTDSDSSTRKAAVTSLAQVGWTAATDQEKIAVAVAQQDFKTAAGFGAASVARIRAVALEGDLEIQDAAIGALIAMDDPAGLEAVRSMLVAPDSTTSPAAAAALKKAGWSPNSDKEALVFYPAVQDWAACSGLGDKAIPALMNAATTTPYWTEAIQAIAAVNSRASTAALVKLLSDPAPYVRLEAAQALGGTQDASARAALKRALKDDDEMVRDAAAAALATDDTNGQ